jgi:hypothetical protein
MPEVKEIWFAIVLLLSGLFRGLSGLVGVSAGRHPASHVSCRSRSETGSRRFLPPVSAFTYLIEPLGKNFRRKMPLYICLR